MLTCCITTMKVTSFLELFVAMQVIVFSFITIIGLMLATTYVTVKLGGVHFNE